MRPVKGVDYVDGEPGNDGKDGRDGIDGVDGNDGKNGKEGSPDTPRQIADKLNTLSEAVDSKVIKGLLTAEDVITEIKKNKRIELRDVKGARLDQGSGKFNMNDQRWHGGGSSALGVSSFSKQGSTSLTGDVTISAGSNITLTQTGQNIEVASTGGATWGDITGTLSNQTDLQAALDAKLTKNVPITGATKTKVTYDSNGLVTAGADATTADIADSTNRRYVTDAQRTVIQNTSGVNTGDQTITLTGDVTGSGVGSFAATIANNAVTNAKMATMATQTFKGRTTAGTGNVEDLTATQATAVLNAFVGDAGSGGTKGSVPAPASGDAAASKYLKADGTWAAIPGGNVGTVTSVTSADGNATVATTTSTPVITIVSAPKLQTARTIGGVSFDGTANIVPQTIQSINESTDTTCFPLFISASGTQSLQPLNNAGLIYNANTNALTAATFIGALTGNADTATSATNATNTAITDDTTTNATVYPTWVTAATGNLPQKVSSTKMSFNPSTGVLTSTSFTGAGTGLTGTAASLTAGKATILATARTIGGTSFDGSGNITVATATGGFTVSGGDLALGANNLTMTGSIGATGARVTKVWATDMTVTNAITGSITGLAGTATALATARAIYGNNFDGTAALAQVIASTYGGTGNGFTKFSGPTTSEKTFTLPDANATIARTDAGQSFTGVQTMTSPALTTPAITGLATGSGVASAATASTLVARDANANITGNNWLGGYTTTATAAGTTTLTVGSTFLQYFTGSTTQTVTLPVASTLTLGHQFTIVNNSSGLVTVNSSGSNAVIILGATTYAVVTCILASGTSAASWNVSYYGDVVTSGKVLTVSNSLTLAGTDGKGINVGAATSGKILIGDGTNMVLSANTFPNASATARKIMVSDGTNWVPSTETWAVPGSSGNYLKSDGTNWTSAAAPTGTGYVLPVVMGATNFAPADATTYFLGSLGFTQYPNTTADLARVYVPKAGTVKVVYVYFNQTAGTSETSTINFRLNNTTDTVISSGVKNDATSTVASGTALSITVAQGDYFEFKWVTPTWVTNPAAVRVAGWVYIE